MGRVVAYGLVAAVLMTGCGPVLRKVDRTGFGIGPYVPSRTGSPLAEGEIRLAGELNSALVLGPQTSEDCLGNAPGIWIPKFQAGGSFFAALSRWVELGLFARFARLDWAKRCNVCVDEFSDHDGSLVAWSAGPSARFNFQIDDPGFFSLAVEMGIARFNQEIDGESRPDNVPHFGLFLEGGTRLDSNFSIYGLIGFEALRSNKMRETWVDDPEHFDDPPDNFGYPVVPVGAGAEFRHEALYLNAVLFYPLSLTSGISFGPAVFAQAGVTL